MSIEATKIQSFETILGAVVDHEEMVVKNVSIITEGVAKGHGVLIDKTTLLQMKEAAEQFDGGLKVKIDHFSGFNGIVGTLRKFRIKGKKLLADLHLLKNHSAAGLILEMADSMADTFGLSASFSGVDEEIGGHLFARVNEIYSADLVDQPAANPSGLFEAKSDQVDKTLPTETKNIMSAQNQTDSTQITALEKQIADLTALVTNLAKSLPKEEKELTDETPLSEINLGTLRGLLQKDTATQLAASGWKPKELSADPKEDKQDEEQDETPKTFEAVIAKHIEGGMSKGEAISFAIRQDENHSLYSDWKARGGQAHL